MPTTSVYFATNRVATGDPLQYTSYGSDILPPTDVTQITYAVADVEGIDLNAENSGRITLIHDLNKGDFSVPAKDLIMQNGNDLLVFIHGFANSFDDSIRRAAFNREWFAAGGSDMTIIAFTWPSVGKVFAAPPHFLPDDYLADQGQAGRSGFHLDAFFQNINTLMCKYKETHPSAHIYLLAHSMGNFALQAAVQSWFDHGRDAIQLFNAAILAAADERYESFEYPNNGRLSGLKQITPRIVIYFSEKDVAMYLSSAVNWTTRLGHEGPKDGSDTTIYAPAIFRIADCAEVGDYNLISPPDASHQYYRRSVKVRSDIIGIFKGGPGGSCITI